MTGYLENVTGQVPLVMDLRIPHDRFDSNSDPSINGHLHYPNEVDRSLTKFPNEISSGKILTLIFSFLIPSQIKRMNHIHNSTVLPVSKER